MEPPKGLAPNAFSHSAQLIRPSNLGSGRIVNVKEDEAVIITEHDSSRSSHEESRPQRSYMDKAAAKLSRFSNSVAVRGSSGHREMVGRYDHLDGADSSVKPDWANHLLDQFESSYKHGGEVSGRDFTTVRMQFSKIYHFFCLYEQVFCGIFFKVRSINATGSPYERLAAINLILSNYFLTVEKRIIFFGEVLKETDSLFCFPIWMIFWYLR